jgi:hypothetical protein
VGESISLQGALPAAVLRLRLAENGERAMTTFTELRQDKPKFFMIMGGGAGILILCAVMALPNSARINHQAIAPITPTAGYVSPQQLAATTRAQQEWMQRREQAASMSQNMLSEPLARDAAPGVATLSAPAAKAALGLTLTPAPDRKIVRTTAISLIVQHPAEAAEKMRTLAENFGGYLETSQISGGSDAAASLTLRVPVAHFEEARAEIRKLGLRVENETLNAQDVTMQYVDQQATLRNLHAEEAQYLEILKRAAKVSDALEVSEKLSEVRGQIEQQQSEFNALSKQTELVAISLSLQTEPPPQTFGLNWRPMLQLKLALHDGLEGVANYATAMIGVLFFLPAVILWVGTIAGSLALGWKLLTWIRRRWFPTPIVEQKPA